MCKASEYRNEQNQESMRRFPSATGLAIALFCWYLPATAQSIAIAGPQEGGADAQRAESCQRALVKYTSFPERCDTALLIGSGALVGALAYAKWWSKGFSGRWKTTHEGWFGSGTYAGGVDKLSHVYSLYLGTRLLVRGLDWTGSEHPASVRTGAFFGLGAAFAAEVFDAYSRQGWGFSKEDLLSGAVGVGMAALMEARPALDEVLAFRLLYRPSGSTRRQWNPVDRYEDQIYLLALRLGGLAKLGRDNPLRYVELVAGYGATGFAARPGDAHGGPDGAARRRRTFYVGVTLDLTRMLDVVWRGPGRWRDAVTETLRYVQPPGTLALAR